MGKRLSSYLRNGWLVNGLLNRTVCVPHSLIYMFCMNGCASVKCGIALIFVHFGRPVCNSFVFLVCLKMILTLPASDGWINNVCFENCWK